MKNVLLYANSSWYLYNFRLSTIKQLVKSGHVVTLVIPDPLYRSQLCNAGATCVEIDLRRDSVNIWRELKTIFALIKIVKERKPDYIFSFTPKSNLHASFVNLLFGAKTILNVSGRGRGISNRGLNALYILYQKWVYKYCHRIFCQNASDFEFFNVSLGIERGRLRLLPGSGVDLEQYSYSPIIANKPLAFGCFCRLIEAKGVKLFAQALYRLRREGFEFTACLGGGVDDSPDAVPLEEIKQWVSDGIIEFLGHVSDVSIHMRNCTIVVLPSYYNEGTPKILLEALAMGRVIVTTDHPGCRDTTIYDNGLTVEPRSLDSLYTAMRECFELGPLDLERMSINSRRLAVDRFNEKLAVSPYMEVLAT